MTPLPAKSPSPPNQTPNSPRERPDHGPAVMTALMMLAVAGIITGWTLDPKVKAPAPGGANWVESPEPLVMRGGDPYIRALMRTISAAESNMDKPYHLLYGGKVVEDLSQHPDECVTIVAGPNRGNCTTAAGRYQFLDVTWASKAEQYHPRPPSWLNRSRSYSFQPQFQDVVVYRWLTDRSAWGNDIGAMLRDGRLDEVLKMLSGTWTSLGYGIETNAMTSRLPGIYADMLAEEL